MSAEVHQQPTEEPQASSPASEKPVKPRHRCYLCSRTYERPDHLSRHLKSHDNVRSYRCSECGKGFNRADLLNRHQAAHTKNGGDAVRRRTARACEACIKARTKCDEERPCKRCRTRDLPCHESEGRRQSLSQPDEQRHFSPLEMEGQAHQLHDQHNEAPRDDFQHQATRTEAALRDPWDHLPSPIEPGNRFQNDLHALKMQQPASQSSRPLDDASLLLGLNGNFEGSIGSTPFQIAQEGPPDQESQILGAHSGDMEFPNFFNNVMMPEADWLHQASIMAPPDVSNYTADLNFDASDFDFSFLASGLTRPSTAQGFRPEETASATGNDLTPHSDAQLRSEAYQRNPFSWRHWLPPKNSHTFSGQEINIRDQRVSTSDQLTSPDSVRLTHCDLTHTERDRLIRVATTVAQNRLSMPGFPSLELLEDLIDICLLQDSSNIDSYIHAASLDCREARSELLLALAAAGARYIALAPVWKTGLVLQEVVRLAIADVLENDNSSTRELQPVQAFMHVLDIGVWSGFRRKTEIAISFLQPPVTMLTWSNALLRLGYQDVIPSIDDSDDVLENKWRSWAEREARKRLVLHIYIHDSQVAIAFTKNPLIAPSQLMLPMPACRDLWLAPNAEAWRHTYFRLKPPLQADTPSMMDLFCNSKLMEQYDGIADKNLCLLASAHGLGHEVGQFRRSARLLAKWQNFGRRDRWMEHQRLQRDILEDLTALQTYCELLTGSSPEIVLTLEFLTMSLHVDLEHIQTFSGKLGEEEARKVYPAILAWSQDTESRLAVWHAGQVLRVAGLFEKTRLRDFYAVALYNSVLTLWVYGMVSSNSARKSGVQTPVQSTPRLSHAGTGWSAQSTRTLVDTSDERAAKAFTLLKQGTPGIQGLQGTFVPLSNLKGVMSTAEAILKSNFPHSQNGLPPLVENLCNLMHELGNLPGKS